MFDNSNLFISADKQEGRHFIFNADYIVEDRLYGIWKLDCLREGFGSAPCTLQYTSINLIDNRVK